MRKSAFAEGERFMMEEKQMFVNDKVRIGVIGLGMRGPSAIERFVHIDGVKTVAICDLYPEKLENSQRILEWNGKPRAAEYSGPEGWKDLIDYDIFS